MNGLDDVNGAERPSVPRRPFAGLLTAVMLAYFAFHAVRSSLPPGWFRDSFPSLLTPPAMLAVVELTPGVRFRSRRVKLAVYAATTLVAAVWLEGIVPRLTPRATGQWGDVAAMALGFALFCAFGRSSRQ